MQARSQGYADDAQRNSMVSVFLRVLEYYSGILFLTTNRIGTFDPAFRSRIHISLYFPVLDRKATMKVFNINLAGLKADNNNYDLDEDGIRRWAEDTFVGASEDSRWNGRQIRNAFQTAVALAEYDQDQVTRIFFEAGHSIPPNMRTKVTDKHFQKVAEAASLFTKDRLGPWPKTTAIIIWILALGFQAATTESKRLQPDMNPEIHNYQSTRTADTYKPSLQLQSPPANSTFDTYEPTTSEPSGRAPRIRQPAMTHGLNIQRPTSNAIAEHHIDDPRYQQSMREPQSMLSPQQGKSRCSSTGEPYQPLDGHMAYQQQPENYFHQPMGGNGIEPPRRMSTSQQHEHTKYTRRAQVSDVSQYQRLDSRIVGDSEIQKPHMAFMGMRWRNIDVLLRLVSATRGISTEALFLG
ncbi:MAG: hypothetical protein Q9213_006618 [Squamulea squamosa]